MKQSRLADFLYCPCFSKILGTLAPRLRTKMYKERFSMTKCLVVIYEEFVSHRSLCTRSLMNFVFFTLFLQHILYTSGFKIVKYNETQKGSCCTKNALFEFNNVLLIAAVAGGGAEQQQRRGPGAPSQHYFQQQAGQNRLATARLGLGASTVRLIWVVDIFTVSNSWSP
jgi:hypothetical protein